MSKTKTKQNNKSSPCNCDRLQFEKKKKEGKKYKKAKEEKFKKFKKEKFEKGKKKKMEEHKKK